ncbi:hypothetical protein [Ruegeria sp. HKCCA4707]|uniref:hypothetical protein n=1 Tax=Ruegeria sp. HKCCA4707 TaxID=2682984 RepID=UPI0014896742|nr:hypothetical protein [Ruegeria sp. HKCCA4707]
MKHAIFALIAAATVSACAPMAGTPITREAAANMSTENLCETVAHATVFMKLIDQPEIRAKLATDHAHAMEALNGRGFTKSELNDISKGVVSLGMRREAAACSWDANKVSTSQGYGSYSEQWESNTAGYGGSYFYVNGAGRVDYIQS